MTICKASESLHELLHANPNWQQRAEQIWFALYTGQSNELLIPFTQFSSFRNLTTENIGNKFQSTLLLIELLPLLIANEPIIEANVNQRVENVRKIEEQLVALIRSASANDNFMERMSLMDKLHFVEALKRSDKLQEIAYWSGVFKISANEKQQKLTKQTIMKASSKQGGKLERLLPSEYLMSESPEAALHFVHRLVENKTKMYDYKRKTVKKKGMLIVCYDESGSMADLDAQGKGFILTLLAIMKKQRRDFIFIPFSGDIDAKEIQVFKKGKYDSKGFLALMQSYIGGGTNFQAPLNEALKQMKTTKLGGDILFITDGISHINEDFIVGFQQKKRQLDFRLKALLVGQNKHPGQLPLLADEIIKLSSFEDPQHKNIFHL